MSSNRSKKLLKTIFTANAGCGCGKPKLSDAFEPITKPKTSVVVHQNPDPPQSNSSASSSNSGGEKNGAVSSLSADEDYCTTSTTVSGTVDFSSSSTTLSHYLSSEPETDHANHNSPDAKPKNSNDNIIPSKNKINDSCIAVVKDSDDPYEDFKHSMKQMIVEKEIYSSQDLQDLLRCFLELNSPSHRDVIVRAFTEIWNEVVSEKQLQMMINTKPRNSTTTTV